jgi:AraC family transcriptional regulator
MGPAVPFSIEETHKIGLWPNNHLIAHSDGLGWHNLYGSVQSETTWEAALSPAKHHCFAYCLQQPAVIHRSINNGPVETAVLSPRQFIITPAGLPAQFRVEGHPTILLIYVHQRVVDRMSVEALGVNPRSVELIPRLAAVDALLEDLALSVLDEIASHESSSVLYVDHLADTVALQLLSRHSTRGGNCNNAPRDECLPSQRLPLSRLYRLRSYLETHLDEELTLEKLAMEAKMSTRHLLRAFTLHFGVPPHQYVLGRRIERVKELLRNSDQPLADIAAETGFCSQSHLCAAFKRSVGLSPSAYRLNI